MKNNEYPFYDLPRIVNDPAIQLANKFGAEAYAITQLAQQMTNILPDYSFLVKNISIGFAERFFFEIIGGLYVSISKRNA